MTLLTGPLLSEEARGTLAGLLTYSRRRGRNVAGSPNNPRQPRTEAQRATRIFMAWLTGAWAEISGPHKATWLNFAHTPLLSPYHAYLSHNANRIKNIPGDWENPALYPNWPGQSYPITRTGVVADFTGETTTPGIGYLDFKQNVVTVNQNWGYAFFRSVWPTTAPAYRTLVQIATVQATGWNTIRVANLAPGPIVLKFVRFTTDGLTNAWWSTITTTIL